MITALPLRKSERTAEALLENMLENGHIDEEGMFCIPLEDWEIDLLSCYGAASEDLEDSDNDEEDALVTYLG